MRKSGDTEKPWLPGFSGQAGTTSHCGLELSQGWSSPSVFSTHTREKRGRKSAGNILKEPLFNSHTQGNSFEVFTWRK